ncbi:F-box/LRR-repeat protein At4g14103-like isoform X1 [Corylus avellana]|uniref:F-box/LRR-repeat protein At4g14103-like isoform X1 n=1 Tax=Corylus avellana TaxID=13451 RepID=UPI001E23A8B3|nr:F-box/LRR-repeat protein At4g14103-like isoform X1 [Corylus avellana]
MQKPNEEQDIDGSRKCLGNFSDEILVHILSFLPTTDAVRTSVLSRKWEYLWTSIPNLDFASSPANRSLLMNFVERALCLRDSSMKRFSLSCDGLVDASRVHSWVTTAIKRCDVQELHIKLREVEGFVGLPYCLFTCKSLKSLSLDMLYVKLPNIICFSCLKILSIQRVTFSNESLTQKLFDGLPVLEELKLENCSWGDLKFVSISAPKLHSLRIFENDMPEHEMQEQYFWTSNDFCLVGIVGHSLKEFYYIGNMINEYLLDESFSLEKAEVVTQFEDGCEQLAFRILKLLTGLSNVEQLKLSDCLILMLLNAEGCHPHMLLFDDLMFNNLMDLIIVENIYLNYPSLVKILQKAPCLGTLHFSGGVTILCDGESIDQIWDPVPPSFLSHLKWIKVSNYNEEDEDELSAVKFLLKNAVVLDEIIISFKKYSEVNLETESKVAKQLSELPRGSQNCKIILE